MCLSQRSEQGCVGPKRAHELLFWSGSHWHPPALLLPDHPITVVRIPSFSFTSAAFESLKHSKLKKSREAEKVVVIVGFFSFFALGAVPLSYTRGSCETTLAEDRSSAHHTHIHKFFETSIF